MADYFVTANRDIEEGEELFVEYNMAEVETPKKKSNDEEEEEEEEETETYTI